MNDQTKKLSFAALFVALTFVGANLKIMGSIAFDSLPAFLGTMLLGPAWGAAIGAIGHLLTAMTSGFPFGLPAHVIITALMGLTMAVYAWVMNGLQRLGLPRLVSYLIAGASAVLINGPLDILALFPLLGPVMGKEALLGLIPLLSMAAAANVIGAVAVYQLMPKAIRSQGRVYLDEARN